MSHSNTASIICVSEVGFQVKSLRANYSSIRMSSQIPYQTRSKSPPITHLNAGPTFNKYPENKNKER